MSCYIGRGSTRQSNETMDDDGDDKDDTKRKSRNLSEKKRRDQFNMLVNELGSMVSTNTRKMDKSTVLKSTISFLKNHNEIAVRSKAHEIQEDWKPSFLSNEEFTHLILEALDGFIMVFSSNGRIYYASESATSLLGYLPSELASSTIYEITYQEDQSHLYNVLLNPGSASDHHSINKENQISFTCRIKRGGLDFREEAMYELVRFVGYFRSDVDTDIDSLIPSNRSEGNSGNETKLVFVGTGRLQTLQLIHEMSMLDSAKFEFTSRHSLEWKFLFLDHRAPPIIGYLPFEVLGTSGYDYYHVDDLDKVVLCHEALMQKGEGTSCYYRFLTKGQQWIWLQTRFYITYNQWNSKPEFIVCTHRVISYVDVMKHMRKNPEDLEKTQDPELVLSPLKHQENQVATSSQIGVPLSPWSSKLSKASRSVAAVDSHPRYHGCGSGNTSMSPGSQSSRNSQATVHSSKPKVNLVSSGSGKPNEEQQPEVDQSNVGFLEPKPCVAAIPVQPVITASFAVPTNSLNSSLPAAEFSHQQSMAMTPAQNRIQDELQKKHEELQQLIVNQQEELRRVSEQLLIARYGILSPLLNVGMPYSPATCQQTGRCVSSTTGSVDRASSSPGTQGMSLLPIPITLPVPIVPIVPSELFAYSLPLSPIPVESISAHSNVGQMMSDQHVQQQHHHAQQSEHQPQQSQHRTIEQAAQQGGRPTEQMSFHMCQQTDMLYTTLDTPAGTQRRST